VRAIPDIKWKHLKWTSEKGNEFEIIREIVIPDNFSNHFDDRDYYDEEFSDTLEGS